MVVDLAQHTIKQRTSAPATAGDEQYLDHFGLRARDDVPSGLVAMTKYAPYG